MIFFSLVKLFFVFVPAVSSNLCECLCSRGKCVVVRSVYWEGRVFCVYWLGGRRTTPIFLCSVDGEGREGHTFGREERRVLWMRERILCVSELF